MECLPEGVGETRQAGKDFRVNANQPQMDRMNADEQPDQDRDG